MALLWQVKMPWRQKLSLAAVLCLSILMIIISIIRVTIRNLPNGQADVAWVTCWIAIEANVAVVAVSVCAYRSLFVSREAASREKLRPLCDIREARGRASRNEYPYLGLPRLPSPIFTRTRSSLLPADEPTIETTASHISISPIEGPGIKVTYDVSSCSVRYHIFQVGSFC